MTPNGKILVCPDIDNSIKVFNLATGEKVCTLKGHLNEIRRISISPDGFTIVSWSEDGCMKVWKLG
ncbi:MAG: hypothetical protein AAFQ91_24660 [Cyanobacteria bacterium J06621_15]